MNTFQRIYINIFLTARSNLEVLIIDQTNKVHGVSAGFGRHILGRVMRMCACIALMLCLEMAAYTNFPDTQRPQATVSILDEATPLTHSPQALPDMNLLAAGLMLASIVPGGVIFWMTDIKRRRST